MTNHTTVKKINPNLIQILKNNSCFKSKKIALAVSGGIDSMVLLDTFNKIKNENSLDLYVFHFDHKWRKTSYLDADLVKAYCKKNKIKFILKSAGNNIPKTEEEARKKRYGFFVSACKKYKIKVLCTAHHKDDQLETIIFRLARGTGPKGLEGVKRNLTLSGEIKVIRPFLDISKKQIAEYAKRNKISFHEDETNKELKYKRNLIRRKITPLLKKINERAVDNILFCSDLIYSQNEILSKYCLDVLKKICKKRNHYVLDRRKFLKLNENTQKTFIYWYLSYLGIAGGITKVDFITRAIKSRQSVDLAKGVSVVVKDDNILFQKEKIKEYADVNNSQQLVIEPYTKKGFNSRFPSDKKKIAYVDMSCFIGKKLVIRHRMPSDIFQPLGCEVPIKLKKYLINKKISREERYNIPLICCGNEVLWLPGYSLSEKLKVFKKPTHVLKLKTTK